MAVAEQQPAEAVAVEVALVPVEAPSGMDLQVAAKSYQRAGRLFAVVARAAGAVALMVLRLIDR